jgi:hypothetical protein
MAEKSPADKIALTLYLPSDVAMRLKASADTRKMSAADLAVDLLDRYLPRITPGGQKKGSIPYT